MRKTVRIFSLLTVQFAQKARNVVAEIPDECLAKGWHIHVAGKGTPRFGQVGLEREHGRQAGFPRTAVQTHKNDPVQAFGKDFGNSIKVMARKKAAMNMGCFRHEWPFRHMMSMQSMITIPEDLRQ